jgi:hypothetical protein
MTSSLDLIDRLVVLDAVGADHGAGFAQDHITFQH